MIKVSKTSKLDGIKSWSLQALDTCPASFDDEGELVPACKGCYATTGNYRFPNVKEPREHNKQDWKRDAWTSDMVAMLEKESYFRWFDSGDMYSIGLALKMLEVMRATPHVKHWLPTRMHKFEKFRSIIDIMNSLPNVVVRLSSDSVTGGVISGEYTSTIIPNPDTPVFKDVSICEAYEHEGKCNGCRACWSKEVKIIAYPAHGKKMQKVVADLIAVA